jgi:hypothetical protein
MAKRPNNEKLTIDEMKAVLQQAGYEVKRRVKYIKHTFVVEEEVWRAFRERVTTVDIKLQDAVTEAFMLWLERHR